MALISEPQGKPDTPRQSNILVESHSRELADLFRALAGIITTDNESPHPGGSVSFEALSHSEQLLTTYFGALKVGLCVLDASFRYLAINQSLAEMNGIPAAEHLGKTVREVLGDFAELVEPQFSRVLASAQPILNLELSFMLSSRSEPGHWIEHY
ncbi:MAG TPA: PAS domain-containing protein, partial [Candidatus Sulfotelmatobacter sp.]|nr:PAS domain-containing protein [Candidatus Sulfotelmatobacter sp.]